MKKVILLFTFLVSFLFSYSEEIIRIELFDGEVLTGKLQLPANRATIETLVIFIHGTGPGTYNDHRKAGDKEFNYFDLFAGEFNKRGIAFFSYNKRGVDTGSTPPFYDTVYPAKYKMCLPHIEVKDIGTVIGFFKADKRFNKSKIVLLGWSEGTILATMAAEDKRNGADALFLAGYVNDNLLDVIKWQYSGESSMVNIKKYFDTNNDNQISKAEYESTENMATRVRSGAFRNAKFEVMDFNKDSVLDKEDFKIINSGRLKQLMDKIEANDDDWIWKNYFRVTTAWLKEHFSLEPNKERMLRLTIPVYIFHGDEDGNTPLEGVYDIQKRFAQRNKTNLQCFVFKGHNHDLNFLNWPVKNEIPEGVMKIFEVAETLNKQALQNF